MRSGDDENRGSSLFFTIPSLESAHDPAAAKDVVLAEEPLIAEETDLLEPTLLDEHIGHIDSVASVYHKSPIA
jgi:hypothetical protein